MCMMNMNSILSSVASNVGISNSAHEIACAIKFSRCIEDSRNLQKTLRGKRELYIGCCDACRPLIVHTAENLFCFRYGLSILYSQSIMSRRQFDSTIIVTIIVSHIVYLLSHIYGIYSSDSTIKLGSICEQIIK